MLWQLIRYVVNGGLVTLLYAIVYAALVRGLHTHPQVATLVGQAVAIATGYILHSRVTFRAHGDRNHGTQIRFVLQAMLSYGMAAFWTWLLPERLHLSTLAPLVPICFFNPIILFAINRLWVFR